MQQRIAYRRTLRSIVVDRGSQDLVYVDESGFEPDAGRRHGWSRRGQNVLAPMLFPGTANAAFHKKSDLEAIAHERGHHILFLPPYRPDFNPIEHDFANLKKRRQYAPPDTPLSDLVKYYGNYSE